MQQLAVLNTFAWERQEVVCLPRVGDDATSLQRGWSSEDTQKLANGETIGIDMVTVSIMLSLNL